MWPEAAAGLPPKSPAAPLVPAGCERRHSRRRLGSRAPAEPLGLYKTLLRKLHVFCVSRDAAIGRGDRRSVLTVGPPFGGRSQGKRRWPRATHGRPPTELAPRSPEGGVGRRGRRARERRRAPWRFPARESKALGSRPIPLNPAVRICRLGAKCRARVVPVWSRFRPPPRARNGGPARHKSWGSPCCGGDSLVRDQGDAR
jgi:hypothetical protein